MSADMVDPSETVEPLPATKRVLCVGLGGVALVLVAFVMGVATDAPRRGFGTHSADGVRALLSCVGLLLAGCAVSMRPGWFGGWLCAAAASGIGYGLGGPRPAGKEWYLAPPRDWYAGLPNSWDSVQLFFGVACVIALIGAVWTRLPRRAVYALILCGVTFHFAGILSAVTSPPPTPWLTDQYWKRVARPYLQFAYMNNAYQFYSPDPGPACEIWACIEYKPDPNDPNPPKDHDWVYIPRRKTAYIDPLGMSFYRRLSITENLAQYQPPGHVQLREEQEAVSARRAREQTRVPRTYPDESYEHRVPNELVTRQVLPSYARHLLHMHGRPGKEVKSVKIYRVLHMITTLQQFRGYDPSTGKKVQPISPYKPDTYLPYFQGQYDVHGHLMDSTDPFLFWHVPIAQVRTLPENREDYKRNGGFAHYFKDFVEVQSGCSRPQE